MKKKSLIVLIFIAFLILFFNTKCYADDLDRIVNYEVTVDPRMNDGTLDITYNIRWRVLDSTSEGPLTWVKIGTANEDFDTITPLTSNIKSIKKYSGSYIRIDFTKPYQSGEEFEFKYSLHQSYMYSISWGKVKYSFTPAWFTDSIIDNMTIKWNMDGVKKDNSKSKQDNYLIWNKTMIMHGGKMTANVTYEKSAFTALNENKTVKQANKSSSSYGSSNKRIDFEMIFSIIFFIIVIVASILGGGGGYYGHRGFYGGGYYGGYHSSCVHSSCACASSCAHSSCACACAGSGRAGCSLKDFYGTNITTEKLKKAF